MPEVHVEIERKFDVGADFALPDLSGVDGVTAVDGPEERRLEAVYHDTPDLRLARARVTLRRRTGGPDAGWHVKLPGGNGARRELHSPLGRAAKVPPKRVQEPVLGIARRAALGPVATLSTRRVVTLLRGEGGAVLAEVADDTVTATLLSVAPGEPATVEVWRELEVELVDGDEALLAAVVQRVEAAGARPSGSASKLARVLAPRLTALDGTAPAQIRKPKKATAGEIVRAALAAQVQALQDADLMVRTEQAEGVHDLRVACRRLRSILAAYRPVLARQHTDGIRDELRWLGQEFSGARDAEVALEHLRGLVREQPVELVLGPVAARLQQEEVKDHAKGTADATRTLRSERYLALRDRLDALVAEPPFTGEADQPAAPVLRAVLARTVRRLRRDVRSARSAEEQAARDHLLHETRKAAKRVRYTAEVAAPVLGTAVADLVGVMKELQDVLGERQDTVVTRAECRRLGLAAYAAGENAWTYGRLEALEEARADRAEREFWASWPAYKAALKQATRR
ncbi:CYTH and CHAD domain-containing protein [Geodermatophilus sp. SYSU D00815]